jgi:glycosyltransferase involved in cell wall biosynthesis
VRHAVINSTAAHKLRDELGLASVTVVPNVMDFDMPFAGVDDFNRDLRTDLGLAPDALLLFQVTRIVSRKGIDTAIHLLHRLEDPSVHFVITGTARDEPDQEYPRMLQRLARDLGVADRVHFAGERFGNVRRETDGNKIYSLSDAYAYADACTYFSTYEGFGNAFVEAVLARRPIFVNDYQPVYWPDIGSLGFDTVMIRNSELTDEAVADVRDVLTNPTRRRRIVDHNFALGKEHFSYQALEHLLGPLFSF